MRSISRQFMLIFTSIMAATIFLYWLANTLLLGRFYTNDKLNTLESVYYQMDDAMLLGDIESEAFDLEFQKIASKHNLDIVIMDTDSRTIKSTVHDSYALTNQLIGYLFNGNQIDENLSKNNKYIVHKINDENTGIEYLELWGILDNGNLIIIRTPMESITDSVRIANRFLTYVGIIAILLSAIIITIISKRITNPILELSKISEKMTNLDFDAKFEPGKFSNEITTLGQNINKLSATLEKTISELKSANNKLEQDIALKNEIDEQRREFLANVSHELKTPIALVQGYAEGLRDCVNDDEESRDFYADVIIDEANKMNKLVRNLLTLDQLENGYNEVVMERFDIVELIKNCVQSVDIISKQSGVTVNFNEKEPRFVWSDEFKIEQIVNNYLSNAIHYAKGDRIVEISFEQIDDKLRVKVFNSGEPIDEEALPKLWTKFYKVDKARTREYGGSGIGLSIVKAISESLGQEFGAINYDNGVTFWFEVDAKA